MSGNAFRDAIHEAVGPYIETDCGPFQHMDIVDSVLDMPEIQWVKQFLVDTLNTDFLSDYQCEIVGPVPPVLLNWAGVDDDWAGGPS